jgi:hypothetical protein
MARLVDCWQAGLTAQQIADEFGDVSRNSVLGAIHRAGCAERPERPKAPKVYGPRPRLAWPPARLRAWPPARLTAAIELWQSGATALQIADRLGATKSSVLGALHRNGAAARPPVQRERVNSWTAEDSQFAKDRRQEGWTAIRIAAALNKSRSTVSQHLLRSGIRAVVVGKRRLPWQQICDMYKAGSTVEDIALRVNASRGYIYKILKKRRVHMRAVQNKPINDPQWLLASDSAGA